MKHTIILTLCVAILAGSTAMADPDYTTVGALIGATAGLIIGNNSHHVDQEFATPVLAVMGALVGREVERRRDARHSSKVDTRYAATAPQPATALPNLHPGVDLIKVSIQNSNGVRTDVPILRLKDKFIGPQGETYEQLPTSDELARKYGM